MHEDRHMSTTTKHPSDTTVAQLVCFFPPSFDPLCRLRQGTSAPAHLLVLVLLQVPRGDQALWVDVGGDGLDELGVRVHVLHLEEGQNVLDLQVVRAVRHGLPFGGQATRGHPVGVLLLLGRKVSSKTDSFIYPFYLRAKIRWKELRRGLLRCRTAARSRSCRRPRGSAT